MITSEEYRAALERTYPNHLGEDNFFSVFDNVRNDEAEIVARRVRGNGNRVFIGRDTFDERGNPLPNYSVILFSSII